jgi:nucleoid-associated protein YgaU
VAPEARAADAAQGEAIRSGAADPANPVVASIDTAQVKRGDSLWRISRTTYGAGRRYTVIFTANDDQIRNPNLIYPGQVLVLPSERKPTSAAR